MSTGCVRLACTYRTTFDTKKSSAVRHTRAIQRDRSKHSTIGPSAEALEEIGHPALFGQMALLQQMGSAAEAVRVLRRGGFLWCSPTQVSQQALIQRLRILPPALFK